MPPLLRACLPTAHSTEQTAPAGKMKQLAQIIKAGVGPEAATLSIGGWDTPLWIREEVCQGRQYGSLARFGDLIDALSPISARIWTT